MLDSTQDQPSTDELLAQIVLEAEQVADHRLDPEGFVQRYPHLAAEIRQLFQMRETVEASRPGYLPSIPERLGHFRILRLVAQGGMGEVYEAIQESLKRRVAIKVIRRGRVSPEACARFHREQEVLAQLHQTHIVPIHFADEDCALQYFVMPFIDGAPLHHVVRLATTWETEHSSRTPSLGVLASNVIERAKRPPERPGDGEGHPSQASLRQPPAQPSDCPRRQGALQKKPQTTPSVQLSPEYFASVAEVLADAAEAVHHAHQVTPAILHRDLKPSNIMVDTTGHSWIIDYGLAGYLDKGNPEKDASLHSVPAERLFSASGVLGTPEYMAPEQFVGQADVCTDVWGLGATLYELLTLRRPFGGVSYAEVQKHVCSTDPVPPNELVANLPADLAAICLKAIQKDPLDRYPNAGEFVRDLRRWLNDEAISIRRPTVWEKTRRWVRRNRVAARVGGVFLMLLMAVGGALSWVAWQQHEEARDARFNETLTQERALLQARNAATAKAFGLLTLARQRVDTPTQGRRLETQAILREAAKLGRHIEPGETAARFHVEIRSLVAATLGVPDIEVPPEARLSAPGEQIAFWQSWPVALHPDGKVLVIGTDRGPVRWVPGEPSDPLRDQDPMKPRPHVLYSPDGSYLALLRTTGGLTVWDGTLTRTVAELPGTSPVLAVGFDPDAKALWACQADGQLRSITLPEGKERPSVALEPSLVAAVFDRAASALVVSTAKGQLFRYEVTGKVLPELPHLKEGTRAEALAWSPDGQLIAVGTSEGNIQLWHANGTPSHQLQAFNVPAQSLAFHPSGHWLLAGRQDAGGMWDVYSGKLVLNLPGLPGGFARDGRSLALGRTGEVSICRLLLPEVLREFGGHRATVGRITWSRDNRHFASLDSAFQIRVWDRTKSASVDNFQGPRGQAPPGGFGAAQAAIALSDDGRETAYASGGGTSARALIRDCTTHQALAEWELPGGFEQLTYASGRFLLAREEFENPKRTMRTVIRELVVGKPADSLRVIRSSEAEDQALFISHGLTPDGRFYWWTGPRYPHDDRRAEVIEVATGRRVTRVSRPTKTPDHFETAANLSPDGRYFCVGTGRHKQQYDLVKNVPPQKLSDIPIAFSATGRWVAWSPVPTLRRGLHVLAMKRVDEESTWIELGSNAWEGVHAVSFSHDGRQLAWASEGGTLTVVDLEDLERKVSDFENSIPRD